MKYIDALNEIKNEYKIKPNTLDTATILTNVALDNFNIATILIVDKNEKVILSDCADIINNFNIDEKKLEIICKHHNIQIKNYALETEYNSLQDLKNFINCLKDIAKLIKNN